MNTPRSSVLVSIERANYIPVRVYDLPADRTLRLFLDHGGSEALEAIENSSLVPNPNYVLNSSPAKHQVVWKVEGMNLEEAESLLHAMAREFNGDPAATDATRVLRIPGFANKKYETNFYVQARRASTETYHLRDFKLPSARTTPRARTTTNVPNRGSRQGPI